MTWADFYLICFLVGFALSLLSFLAGACICTCRTCRICISRALHAPHAHAHGDGAATAASMPYSISARCAAFLAWFGGTGYLLARYSALWFLLALGSR